MPSLMFGIDASGVINGAGSAVKAINGLTASASGAQRMLTNVATALVSYKMVSAVSGVNMLAARYETLGIVMTVAGKNVEYTYKQMNELDKALQKEGISMLATRSVLAKMSAAYIDLGKSSELAKTAQNVAVVGGINSSEALERMTGAIVKAEIEMLRTIGINANFEQGYKTSAAAMGKTIDQLTEYEKIQSRVNTVIDQGAGYAGIYTASMLSAGKQITSMPRLLENMVIMTGEISLEAFSSQITTAYEFLVDIEKKMQELRDNNGFAGITDSITAGTTFIKDNFSDIALSFGAIFGGRYITQSLASTKESFAKLSREVNATILSSTKARVTSELAEEFTKSKESVSIARRELEQKKQLLSELRIHKERTSANLQEARLLPSYGEPGGTKQNDILVKRQSKAYRDANLLVVAANNDVVKATDRLKYAENSVSVVRERANEQLKRQSVTLSKFAMSVETSKLALSRFGSSVVSAFGGPAMFAVTAAMTAISAGMLLYKSDAEKAERSTNKIKKAMADLEKLAPIDVNGKLNMLDSEFTFRAASSRIATIREEAKSLETQLDKMVKREFFSTNVSGTALGLAAQYANTHLADADFMKSSKELKQAYDTSAISASKYVDKLIELDGKRLRSRGYTEDVIAEKHGNFLKDNLESIVAMEELAKNQEHIDRIAKEMQDRQTMSLSLGDIQKQSLAFDDAKMQKSLADIRLADFKSTLTFEQKTIVDAFTKVGLDFGILNKLVSDGLLNINTTEKDLNNALQKYNEDAKARRESFINSEIAKTTSSSEYTKADPLVQASMYEKAAQSANKQAESMFSAYTYSDLTLENFSKIATEANKNADIQEILKNYELDKARLIGEYKGYQDKIATVTALEVEKTRTNLGLSKEQLTVLETMARLKIESKDKTMEVGGVTFDYSSYASQLSAVGIVTKDVELNVMQLALAFTSTFKEVEASNLQLQSYTSQGKATEQMLSDATEANKMFGASQNAIVSALLSSGASLSQVKILLEAYAATSVDAARSVDTLITSLENAAIQQQSEKLASFMEKGSTDKASYFAREISSLNIINEAETEGLTILQRQKLVKEAIANGTLATIVDPSQITDGYTLNGILEKIATNYSKITTKEAGKSAFPNLAKEVAMLTVSNDALEANSSSSEDKWERRRLAIQRTYEVNVAAIQAETKLDSQRASANERSLLTQRESESLRKEVLERDQRLLDASNSERDQEINQMRDRVSFYDELTGMTNSYNLNVADSNALLEEQARRLSELGIPDEYIEEWIALKQLQASTDPVDQMNLKVLQYSNSMKNWGEQTGDSLTKMFDGMADGIGNFAVSTGLFFTDSKDAVRDLGLTFSEVAKGIINDLAKIYAKMLITGLVKTGVSMLFGGIGGGGGGGGFDFISNAVSGLPKFEFAKGGVLGDSSISDYSSQILTKPTMFSFDSMISKFAKGGRLGVAGEAGKEAVMPLGTDSSGALGVKVVGNYGGKDSNPVVNVTFIDNVGVSKKTEQRKNEQGGLDLQVMIDKAISTNLSSPGSMSYKTMSGTWQGTPALANR